VVKQGRLGPVDDLVFAAPEEQLAEDLGEHPGCSHHEVDGGGEGGIQVRVPDELPAGFVDERESDVVNDEVEVGKVRGGTVHVPGLGVLDRLRPEGLRTVRGL
jgi:hypothetical protein